MALYPFCVIGDVENLTRQNMGTAKAYSSSTTPTLTEVKGLMDDIASQLRSTADTAGYDVDSLHETATTVSDAITAGGAAIHESDFSTDADGFTGTNATLAGAESIAGVSSVLKVTCSSGESQGSIALAYDGFDDGVGLLAGRYYEISLDYYANLSGYGLVYYTDGGTALTLPDGTAQSTEFMTASAWTTLKVYRKIPPTAASDSGIKILLADGLSPLVVYLKNITIKPVHLVADISGISAGDTVKIEGLYTSGRQYEFSELFEADNDESVVGAVLANSYYTSANLYVVNDALRILRNLNSVGAAALALRASQTGIGRSAMDYADQLWAEYQAGREKILTVEGFLRGATTDSTAITTQRIQSYGSEHSTDTDVEPVFERETDL